MKEIQITLDLIEEFLGVLEEKGRKKQSVQTCRRILQQWYESLPEDKFIAEDALDRWGVTLREKGVADNTLVNRVTTVKSFLKHLEFPVTLHIKVPRAGRKRDSLECALTRSEYQLLLHATKESGNRRTYLLIKTIGGLGIRSTEIQDLTVDHVKQGETALTTRGGIRRVKILEPIRSDLLEFVDESGIEKGPVFITQEGLPLQHFLIWKQIKKVCRQVGLPEEKGIPSTLFDMYLETKRCLSAKSVEEANQKYFAFLQEEEATIGWNDPGVQQKSFPEEGERAHLSDIAVKTVGKTLGSEEKEHLAYKIGEALSKTLTDQYTCEVTIRFKRKEDVCQ